VLARACSTRRWWRRRSNASPADAAHLVFRAGFLGNRLLLAGFGFELLLMCLMLYVPAFARCSRRAAAAALLGVLLLFGRMLLAEEARKAVMRRGRCAGNRHGGPGGRQRGRDEDHHRSCGRMGPSWPCASRRRTRSRSSIATRGPSALGPVSGATVEGIAFDRDVLRAPASSRRTRWRLTAGDNANIIVARVARNVFGSRRSSPVYDPRRAKIYRRLGLQTVSTTAWGVTRMTQLIAHASST